MDMSALSVAVLGASGYAGAELLRLLAAHPGTEVRLVGAGASAGRDVTSVYPHLVPYAGMKFEDAGPDRVAAVAGAAFLALPHEESAAMVPALAEAGVRVIDLSGAYRLPAEDYPGWYGFRHPAPAWLEKGVYGLPELFAAQIAEAALVANPGCYPTAVLLALAPLLAEGLIPAGGIVVDAKSGLSGAGRTPTETTHFVTADGSVRPYQAGGTHRHVPEMLRILGGAAGAEVSLTFVPHLVPASRGLLATCYAPTTSGPAELTAALAGAYAGSPFVRVLSGGMLPDTKRVTGSNAAEIGVAVDAAGGTAVVTCAIDNLGKGAAGQAVQNLNLMHGFPETMGLEHLAVVP